MSICERFPKDVFQRAQRQRETGACCHLSLLWRTVTPQNTRSTFTAVNKCTPRGNNKAQLLTYNVTHWLLWLWGVCFEWPWEWALEENASGVSSPYPSRRFVSNIFIRTSLRITNVQRGFQRVNVLSFCRHVCLQFEFSESMNCNVFTFKAHHCWSYFSLSAHFLLTQHNAQTQTQKLSHKNVNWFSWLIMFLLQYLTWHMTQQWVEEWFAVFN